MEKFAAVLFAVGLLTYIGLFIFGMISLFPWGLIGLFLLIGMGILFFWVLKQRLNNAEDNHYSKNVEK